MRFEEVGKLIVDPDIISDMPRYVKLTKEYKDKEEIVNAYHDYKNVLDNLKSSFEMLSAETDPDFKEMAKAEIKQLETEKEDWEEKIKWMLIPKDPEDDKNCLLYTSPSPRDLP